MKAHFPQDMYMTWSRDFSFLNCSLIAESHVQNVAAVLGVGYNICAFTFSQGEVHFYRSHMDEKKFNQYVGETSLSSAVYRKNLCERLSSLTDSLNDLIKHTPKLDKEAVKTFLNLHREVTPYHIGVYWAADFIAALPEKKPETVQALEELTTARHYNEHLYPDLEKWLKSQKYFSFLTPQELQDFFKDGKTVSEEILRDRQDFAYMIYDTDGCSLLTGDAARKAFESDFAYLLLTERGDYHITEFRGVGIQKGTTRGRVRIIERLSIPPEIDADTVIVTRMTRPQFNYLFGRARAIVTDEGALLSHAAILAREYNIPTVIGTKIATRVLKDGDLVEVDADNGVVRVLKRNEGSSINEQL